MQWFTASNGNVKPYSYSVGVTLALVMVPAPHNTIVLISAVCKWPVITNRWSNISAAGLSFIVFTCW